MPPFILRYNASSVPILQLALASDTLTEQQLFDYGINRIRQQIATVPGRRRLPLPYGGKPRQIMVDLDPQALLAHGLSPRDVSNAISRQNLILPAGTREDRRRSEYRVSLNSSPDAVAALNDLPIKTVNGATVYVRDVAHVRDGFARADQHRAPRRQARSVLLTILKNGGASTLDVVQARQGRCCPTIRAAAPPGLEIDAALRPVDLRARRHRRRAARRALIAAGLTGADDPAVPRAAGAAR